MSKNNPMKSRNGGYHEEVLTCEHSLVSKEINPCHEKLFRMRFFEAVVT